jgi:uncharacterized protein with NRDE domain
VCLLIVVSGMLPDWPLVVAANRDEYYVRPSAPLSLLRDRPPRTLGGRDLVACGTWLAVNEHGVVAGLTNKPVPTGRDPTKRSRGEIPLVLTAARSAQTAVHDLEATVRPGDFNPSWALVGDRSELYAVDLTLPEGPGVTRLGPGVHVLENRPPGAPSTKVDHVLRRLSGVVARRKDRLVGRLEELLADHTITLEPGGAAQDERRAPLSSCCVHADDYGTRSSTLVCVPRSAAVMPEVRASDGPSCAHPLVRATFEPE